MSVIFENVQVLRSGVLCTENVYVKDGKISGPFEDRKAMRVDGSGKILLPGAIDAHVHFREPGSSHKETWETGSAAAAMGGVTTVLDMPNTQPATTTVEALEQKRALVLGRSHVNYGFHFGASGAGNIPDLLAADGIFGVKIYMGSSTGDLLVEEPSVWEKLFRAAKEKNIPVIVHAENEERIRERWKQMHQLGDPKAYAEVRDNRCAELAVEAALLLRKKVGNRLHVAHMSTKEEVNLLRSFACPQLTCEVAPHHLFFSKDDLTNSLLKMNPPLRSLEDVKSLWEALRDGTVDCIATDHAPHTLEEKDKSIWDAPAGVPGVEFVLPLMLNEVNQNMLSLARVVDLLSESPARIFGLKNKGKIQVGMDADLVLVDMDLQKKVDKSMVLSKCGWTPYEGYSLKGWPILTMVNGEVVMSKGSVQDCFPGKEACKAF